MKKIGKKLQSNGGATMIIALLFMLVCVFVGGAVLTAASVNGGRLEGKRSEQQAILDQRSIAAVVAGELSENGLINLSFPLGTENGRKSLIRTGDMESPEGVKLAIFNSTRNAYRSVDGVGSAEMTVSFTDPAGERREITCIVETTVDHGYIENRIRFTEDPKVMIELGAMEGSSSVTWHKIEVKKGGVA